MVSTGHSTRSSAKARSTRWPSRTPSSPSPGSPSRKPTFTGADDADSKAAAGASSSPTTATRPSSARALASAYAAKLPCQSRWSSAMLSTAPPSGRSDGAQNSWKLDSSTASTSAGWESTSRTGSPMLPQSTARRPSATSIACSIEVVVVLPLVPVTTSHVRGRAVVAGRVQAPGQFHVAPDRHPGRRGGGQHRCGRRETRAGDHQGERPDQRNRLGRCPGMNPVAGQQPQRGLVVVADRDVDIPGRQRTHDRAPGDARAGHQNLGARRQRLEPSGHVSHRWRTATRRRTARHRARTRSR